MANKEIIVKIDGDTKGLEKAVGKADDTLDKLGGVAGKTGGKLDGLGGKVGGLAKDNLGPLGDAAEMAGVGLDGVGTSGLVAGAAVAGMATFVAGGVQKLGEMTAEVRKFKDASGATWEESSRLVAVFDDMGVSAETGAGAMARLAKNVDAGKFEDFGVQVVRAKDGTIDMVATLGAAADAMNSTADPAKRAAMGTALFGKSWAELMPVLQQGSGGIRQAMDGVADYQIVTEESAAKQREMSLAVDDLQDAIGGLQMSLASDLIPELAKMASEGAAVVNMLNSMTAKIGGLGTFIAAMNPVSAWKSLEDGEEAITGAGDAAVDTEANIRAMAAAEDDAADASRRLAAEIKVQEDHLKALNDTTMTIAGTQLAFESAQRSTAAAAADLTAKTAALQLARQEYGDGSPQAVEAQRAYENALGGSKEAADRFAQATVALAEKHALLSGEALTAQESQRIYSEALGQFRDSATDPNLVAGMDSLIGQVGSYASAADSAAAASRRMTEANQAAIASAALSIAKNAIGVGGATPGRAMGGPASGAVLVGERGPEQVILPQGSRVVPNHAMRSNGGGITVNVATNASPWAIAREIDWLMRTGGR